jgi:Phage major capsid protein E
VPPTFDIYDQAALTALINEPVDTALESAPRLGDQIAPLQNTESRMARMDIGRQYSFGIGQFKAPNAMPALVEMPVTERREQLVEMIQLEEMHRINSEQWMRLRSNDENVRRAEGLDIVDRGVILRRRMERLTEKMRWDVFTTGALTVTYPRTNSQLFIDYGFLPGHKPVLAGTALWTDTVNADPVADLEAWQQLVADDSGFLGTMIHLTSQDAKLILTNQKLKTYFNVPTGTPFRPTLQQVAQLLADGTTFVIWDAGWRPMMSGADRSEAAHTRYLPIGKVLVTTPYTIEGERIADTLNGQVDVSVAYNEAEPTMGPANEVILNHMDKNRYLREAASRIVRLLHPESFLCATVR